MEDASSRCVAARFANADIGWSWSDQGASRAGCLRPLDLHTTYDTDEEIYQAIRAGAKGYLLKDAPLEELLDSIRKVHAGETCIPPALGAKLASRMSGEALTDREVDVLKLLARGRSNKEIGTELFISEKR
jgi:DNA-binding NarL/FixJ family response regulator